jgi:hypothetical protein
VDQGQPRYAVHIYSWLIFPLITFCVEGIFTDLFKDKMDNQMKSIVKQQKAKPRGRPFPPGVSGNPGGRPRGSLNKITLAVLAGMRNAEEESAGTLLLDKSRPFESWDGYFFQDGLRFDMRTLEALPIDGPRPVEPAELDPRERRTEFIWKNRRVCLQNGWTFDPVTWEAVKI